MNSLLGIHMYTKYGTMSLVDLQTYITSKQEFESFHVRDAYYLSSILLL